MNLQGLSIEDARIVAENQGATAYELIMLGLSPQGLETLKQNAMAEPKKRGRKPKSETPTVENKPTTQTQPTKDRIPADDEQPEPPKQATPSTVVVNKPRIIEHKPQQILQTNQSQHFQTVMLYSAASGNTQRVSVATAERLVKKDPTKFKIVS
jgi:hypothetical protein